MALAPSLLLFGVPHRLVDGRLLAGIPSEQGRCNAVVDIGDGFQHAFAAKSPGVSIAQFNRLAAASRGAGGYRCPAVCSAREFAFHFHGWVAPGVEDLACMDLRYSEKFIHAGLLF